MNLYEREPAQRFDDAHLLGNGRLGASVYGGVPFEEILINDDTLWSGSESYRVNEEYYEYLKQAQALALKGDVKKAYELINDHMEGSWSQAYMPLGSALICVGQKDARRNMPFKHVLHPEICDYRRTLDFFLFYEYCEWVMLGNRYDAKDDKRYSRSLSLAKECAERLLGE